MSEVNEVPKSWEIRKLGEVFFTTSGGTPSRKNPDYYTGNIPWVKSGELDKGLILDTEEKISELAVSKSSAKIFPAGTLLIALYGATIGKLGFLGVDAATNQAICGIFENEIVDLNFQRYFLLHKRHKLIEQGAGGAQPNISQTILKNLDIVIPPLPEQHRIVAKIEALFSSLDKGIETLQTAQQQLKVYRQAVLKWAFEGKLSSTLIKEDSLDYHDSRNSAKNQGDQANPTNQGADKGELPEGWKWIILKEICEIRGGVTKGRNFRDKKTVHLPYLRVANVQDGYLDLNVIKDIEALETDLEKYRLLFGDILYTEGGDRDKLGRGTIWKNEVDNCIHQNHIFRARPLSDRSDSKFISYYSQTKEAKNYFLKHGKQTTNLASINITVLSNLPIPIPSTLEEQLSIVAEIESRLSVCDKIEETITQSLQQSEALRQSILKKAFEGKLVPQNPADEPASVLLERIRAEREVQPAKVKKPKVAKKEKKVKPGTQLKLL